MNFTEPIRSLAKISQIKNLLRGEWNLRDLLLFELWINSALRISDLLTLKVKDLFWTDIIPRNFFDIKEEKTWKMNRITITPKVKGTLADYAGKYPDIISNSENYIFFKRKTFPLGSASIGRKRSWSFLSKICEDVWLKGNYWNHSLRKTWGYQARMASVPLEIIQHKLNHSSLAITQRYLWITMDEIEDACNKLDL